MIDRFRIATRATGIRRQVFVHIYDDVAELARAHAAARQVPYDPEADVAGGVVIQQGFPWPRPPVTPIIVMRLWTGQLTARTIAHEATHAAAGLFFMDAVRGWESRARPILLGDNETLAYLVGDIAAEVTDRLWQRGYFTKEH